MIKRISIYIVTVIFILFFIFLMLHQLNTFEELPFSVQILMDNETETINLWEGDDGVCYVFLPSCGETARMRVHLNTSNPIYLDGQTLTEGFSCDELIANRTYTLRYRSWGLEKEQSVVFLRSANVPAMFLDTQSGSMDYIHTQKGNEESGMLRLYTEDGALNYAGTLESIKGRGNSTWTDREKKPYSLILAENADLLGMGEAQKWILLANADDASHMRNKIVFDFATAIGMAHAPDSQWVEVYLNKTYAGLYLLCERNEVHPQRLDIANQDSFLVSLENGNRLKQQNYPHFSTESRKHLRIHYYQNMSEEAISKLAELWQSVENAIRSSENVDPSTGKHLNAMIDYDSWVTKYLLEELFGNIDAGNLSQYFYYDGNNKNNKIVAGPVWDYDHALGNRTEWQLVAPNTFFSNRKTIEEGDTSPWYYYLAEKDSFICDVAKLYQEKCVPLLDKLLEQKISTYTEVLEVAAKNDAVRWNIGRTELILEMEYICSFLKARIDFLDRIWVEGEEYYTVRARRGSYGYYCYYVVFPGECLMELPVFESTEDVTYQGWYYSDTDEPFDPTQPITEDIEIYAKWQPNESNKLKQMLKLAPLGVIAVIGVGLLWVEVKRGKRSR